MQYHRAEHTGYGEDWEVAAESIPSTNSSPPKPSGRWFRPKERLEQLDGAALVEPTASSLYQYFPLRHREIRILYIERARHYLDPLRCTIKHGPIDWIGDFDPYMTLSYCWGRLQADGSHLDSSITCDGTEIHITSNLEMALRYIRLNFDDITSSLFAIPRRGAQVGIWIDALCIDQSNTIERNHQVKHMAEIYSNSARLIIWLGAPAGIGILTALVGTARCSTVGQLCRKLMSWGILKSPWFTRRWIIEEYGLTPIHSRFFLFGPILFPCLYSNQFLAEKSHGLHQALAKLDKFGYDPSNSLLYNLYRFDGAICSKTHDLVYSLLALSSESEETAGISVDYSQTIEDCFVDVARSIVKAENVKMERLGPLLAIASAKRSASNSISLPSWVPDWRVVSEYKSDEHRQAVEFLLDRLEFERYADGSVTNNGVSVQRKEQMFSKGFKAIEGHMLAIQGRFLTPCFPPAHQNTQNATVPVEPNQYLTTASPDCWTCQLFAPYHWEQLTEIDKETLQSIDDKTQTLFMIPRVPVVYVLNRSQGSSADVFELAYCFRTTHSVSREHYWQHWREIKTSEEARRKFFQTLDTVTLL